MQSRMLRAAWGRESRLEGHGVSLGFGALDGWGLELVGRGVEVG